MHIWIAADLDPQLGELKSQVCRIRSRMNFDDPSGTLPLHISLKISFEIGEDLFEDALCAVTQYCSALSPFPVRPEKVEQNGTIVWIRIGANDTLRNIHGDLTGLVQERFGIAPHEFDLDFKFHTTLFFGSCRAEADRAFAAMQNLPLPAEVTVNRFLIGTSPTGQPGTYRVIREIDACSG